MEVMVKSQEYKVSAGSCKSNITWHSFSQKFNFLGFHNGFIIITKAVQLILRSMHKLLFACFY